ncbi:MAG: 16S rRNA processing protein RimM [Candidatus Desulforudis sp.]|nr:16S rRNA processing protein RimM [Desulforudis sp.]
MTEAFISIGEIVNTQGRQGAVRVLPLTDFPERFRDLQAVYLARGGERRLLQIEKVTYHKQFAVIKFREISDMTAAERLKGALLQVPGSDLVPLPDGHYYIFDIVGIDVYTLEGEHLGVVRDVLRTGANDVYTVQTPGGRPLLIPALKAVVREINLESGRMTVVLPEGLRE